MTGDEKALFKAIKNQNIEEIVRLIDLKVNLLSKNNDGWTSTMYAKFYGNKNIKRFFKMIENKERILCILE